MRLVVMILVGIALGASTPTKQTEPNSSANGIRYVNGSDEKKHTPPQKKGREVAKLLVCLPALIFAPWVLLSDTEKKNAKKE